MVRFWETTSLLSYYFRCPSIELEILSVWYIILRKGYLKLNQ